jgi:hypothetical protein
MVYLLVLTVLVVAALVADTDPDNTSATLTQIARELHHIPTTLILNTVLWGTLIHLGVMLYGYVT